MIEICDNLIVMSRDEAFVHKDGGYYIISVAKEWKDEFVNEYYSFTDDEKNSKEDLMRAVENIKKRLDEGKKIIIYCNAGQSRSPSIAYVAYTQFKDISIDDLIQKMEDKGSWIAINGNFFIKLSNIYNL